MSPGYQSVPVRAPQAPTHGTTISVTSESFADGGLIGMDFVFLGCGGKNISPQLSWSGVPAGTKSFAITCFDPDAPTGSGYWHWLVCDIPSSAVGVDAGAASGKGGYSDFGVSTYGGPCPPKGDGEHRYIFTVHALDVNSLGAGDRTTGATFNFMMRGHVLATGSIMGRFGH